MNRENYEGQQFGNRVVIRNHCVDDDWLRLGLNIPKQKDKYRLTKCLNCGSITPCLIKNLINQPPKRCVFCSNIGNHSHIDVNTNTWTTYDDYAVCNVLYDNRVISFYVDLDDYDRVRDHVWRISKKRQKYYVVTGSKKKRTMMYLHSMVLGYDGNEYEIDHIDGNSLNNRRSNLRLVSRQGNIDNQIATRIDNQIGIRGVVYNKKNKKYKVDFHYHGKRFYTKDWQTIEEAVWCRYCFEEYFGLPAIKNNPLAGQYYTLSEDEKETISKYVNDKILGNER